MAHCHGFPDQGAVVEAGPRWWQRFTAVRRFVGFESASPSYQLKKCLQPDTVSDVYFVDIFRVRGGSTHDWMLHGPRCVTIAVC